MPYSLHLKLKNGTSSVLKPIANDKADSPLGFDDPRIEKKLIPLIGKLKKDNDVLECYFKRY
jgi:hypothetical protein